MSGEQNQPEVLTDEIIETRPADIDQADRQTWINRVAEALYDMTTMPLELFAQIHLNLSPGKIQEINDAVHKQLKVLLNLEK